MPLGRRLALGIALAVLGAGAAAQGDTRIERGAYLVPSLGACGNCHTPRDAKNQPVLGLELAGGFAFDEPVLGHIVGPNITPDKETGIGGWTEGQIVNALRNGKRPDGSVIAPPMPIEMYRGLSARGAGALAAFLKRRKP